MGDAHTRNGEFRKIAEHLHRYSANKIHYAVFKLTGKRIWESLETPDHEMANRKLKVGPHSQGAGWGLEAILPLLLRLPSLQKALRPPPDYLVQFS